MTDKLRIGLLHIAVAHKQPEKNRAVLFDLLKNAATQGAQLVVTPELSLSGYSFRSRNDILPYVESENSATVRALSEAARNYSIYVCSGMAEKDERTGIVYNSVFVIDPEGKIVCRYRKINAESRWACAGSPHQNNTFETPWGRMGVLICSDSYYGLIPRCTALRGADLIIVVTNWPPSGLDPKELWRARALENGVFLVACNRGGVDLTMDCSEAPSCVYDPCGNEIFEGRSSDSELFIVDIPLTEDGRLDGSYRKAKLSKRQVELYGDCTLNLWPVRDITSFLGLPSPGIVPICCVVPEQGEHPVSALERVVRNKFIDNRLISYKGLYVLPVFRAEGEAIENLKQIARACGGSVLWREGREFERGCFLVRDSGEVIRWRMSSGVTDGERPFPEFDFRAARIVFAPFEVLEHPEFAVAAAKRGCDIVLVSEGFLQEGWSLLGGVRTTENIAVGVCGLNGAGIWTPPQGHERWGEVLAGKGDYCLLELDTALTRNKRFQDRVDFELLLCRQRYTSIDFQA
ncbi:MAG: nitrilase-related carbon-nitrogen hydrolase [Thermodesulforhabdaceae bacterium]